MPMAGRMSRLPFICVHRRLSHPWLIQCGVHLRFHHAHRSPPGHKSHVRAAHRVAPASGAGCPATGLDRLKAELRTSGVHTRGWGRDGRLPPAAPSALHPHNQGPYSPHRANGSPASTPPDLGRPIARSRDGVRNERGRLSCLPHRRRQAPSEGSHWRQPVGIQCRTTLEPRAERSKSSLRTAPRNPLASSHCASRGLFGTHVAFSTRLPPSASPAGRISVSRPFSDVGFRRPLPHPPAAGSAADPRKNVPHP